VWGEAPPTSIVVSHAQVFSGDNLSSSSETPSYVALRSLAIFCKADAGYHPIKDSNGRRWRVRTEAGEFEILTMGVKWYDPHAKVGGGGAIDLAMHILQVSFVDAVKILSGRIEPRG
jgi:hypothetical protein